MNYAQLKAEVIDLMARTDYTDTKAGLHVNRAIDRIARVAELPLMEKVIVHTLTDSPTMYIPNDYVSEKHVIVDDVAVEKVDYARLLKVEQQGSPKYYARLRDLWEFRPVNEGAIVTIIYHAAWEALANSTDVNQVTTSAPDAIIYCAASYAATYFGDSRQREFEERYLTLAAEVKEQHHNQEMASGAPMAMQPVVQPNEYYGGY